MRGPNPGCDPAALQQSALSQFANDAAVAAQLGNPGQLGAAQMAGPSLQEQLRQHAAGAAPFGSMEQPGLGFYDGILGAASSSMAGGPAAAHFQQQAAQQQAQQLQQAAALQASSSSTADPAAILQGSSSADPMLMQNPMLMNPMLMGMPMLGAAARSRQMGGMAGGSGGMGAEAIQLAGISAEEEIALDNDIDLVETDRGMSELQGQDDMSAAREMVNVLRNSGNPKFANSQFVSFVDKLAKGEARLSQNNTVVDQQGQEIDWESLYDVDAANASQRDKAELDAIVNRVLDADARGEQNEYAFSDEQSQKLLEQAWKDVEDELGAELGGDVYSDVTTQQAVDAAYSEAFGPQSADLLEQLQTERAERGGNAPVLQSDIWGPGVSQMGEYR